MNKYEAEKKDRDSLRREIDAKDAELQTLRAEIEVMKAGQLTSEINDSAPCASQQRVDEIEAELDVLRQSFAIPTPTQELTQPLDIAWHHVPRTSGPASDSGDTVFIHEDHDADPLPSHQPSHDTDALMMGLELESARQAKSSLLGSFRDHVPSTQFTFADSPARHSLEHSTGRVPDTPQDFHHALSKQLKEAMNRAEEAEVALTALDAEISSLGFGNASDDTMTMITAIATHFTEARIHLERSLPGESTIGLRENRQIIPELLCKLSSLTSKLKAKDREISSAKDQQRNLKNNFEKAIVAAENATARIARLEKEMDDYVSDTLHVRMRSQELEKSLAEKENDVTSLSAALNKYRSDITRLEGLVESLQNNVSTSDMDNIAQLEFQEQRIDDLEARVASEQNGRRAAETSAVGRLAKIQELELTLQTSQQKAMELERAIVSIQTSSSHDADEQQAQIISLNARITNLSTSLASANAEIDKLRIIRTKLEERVQEEIQQGAAAVEGLQEQLLRAAGKMNKARIGYINGAKMRYANWELHSEGLDAETEAEISNGSETGPETPGLVTSDTGLETDGVKTPTSSTSDARTAVRFAEWADVETYQTQTSFEGTPKTPGQPICSGDDVGSVDGDAGGDDDHVPGSVTVERGRGRYRRERKTPKLVRKEDARRLGYGLGLEMQTEANSFGCEVGINADGNASIGAGSNEAALDQTSKKRRYDSGIGLDELYEVSH